MADHDDVSKFGIHGRRGDEPRQPDRRRDPARWLRQDHAGVGDGRVTQAKLSVDAGALKDKPTLNYDWSGYPDRVEFSLEDADLLTDMSGAFIIKDNGDETEVTFELTVALSMPVPEMMRTKAEKSTIDLALKQLKEKLEN